jgi:hypothetical protein
MSNFPNASPTVIAQGIKDNSPRAVAIVREQIPTHVPLVLFFAKKGPLIEQLVSPQGAIQMYGDDTFDLRKKYAKHTTALMKVMADAGQSAFMMKRVVPSDAGPKANATLWADVLPKKSPQYERDSQGQFVLDQFGSPIPIQGAPDIDVLDIRFVVTHITAADGVSASDDDSLVFGKEQVTQGTRVNEQSQTSTMYPLFQYWDSFPGEGGNDAGIRIYAPTENSGTPVNQTLLRGLKAYPYRMSVVRRQDSNSTPRIVNTLSGAMELEFVLPKGQINPATDASVSIDTIFPTAWEDKLSPGFVPVFGDVGKFHVYHDHITTVLDSIYSAERAYLVANPTSPGSDLNPERTDESHMINLLGLQSSSGAPLYTAVLNKTAPGSVIPTESTNLLMAGGSDGSMTFNQLDSLTKTEISRYADPRDEVQNDARNVVSFLWDSGFGLDTKKSLAKFIAVRKDTFVVTATHIAERYMAPGGDGGIPMGAPLSSDQETALAASLRTNLSMYIESAVFGTPTTRALIMGRHGRLVGYPWDQRVSLVFDMAEKVAKMMGAGDGKWKPEFLFDNAEFGRNIITRVTDLNDSWTPPDVRNQDWDNGLNYAMDFSRDRAYYPCLKTVYPEDTSVLTSFFFAAACVELQKIGNQIHRIFSGTTRLTGDQLVERINTKVAELANGKFANMFRVVPKAQITSGDRESGFKWTLVIQIGGGGMKTVQTLAIEAMRLEDMTA